MGDLQPPRVDFSLYHLFGVFSLVLERLDWGEGAGVAESEGGADAPGEG